MNYINRIDYRHSRANGLPGPRGYKIISSQTPITHDGAKIIMQRIMPSVEIESVCSIKNDVSEINLEGKFNWKETIK